MSIVFFYGLFMDKALLASKNIHPIMTKVGFIEGFKLHIGQRATLLPSTGDRAYGVVMTIAPEDVEALYSDPGVADYVAESVTVQLPDGSTTSAMCYNLPGEKLSGTNPDYAEQLLTLASKLGFPKSYLEHIRQIASES